MNEIIIKEYLGDGISFKVMNDNIYANATEIAKVFPNKNLSTWVNSKATEEYVKALCSESGRNKDFYIEVIKGGLAQNQGTWIHEKLILDLARWCNINFRIWCDEQIATLIREGKVSLRKQTEESMLLELFPDSDSNLILLTAQNIRENKSLKKEVIYKEDVIIGLTKDIDLETKRKVLNNVVRHKGANYSERWRMLYKHFEDKYGVNLKRRRENFDEETKPKSKSMLDFVDRGMDMVAELYEIATKLYEGDIKEILEHYQNIR